MLLTEARKKNETAELYAERRSAQNNEATKALLLFMLLLYPGLSNKCENFVLLP